MSHISVAEEGHCSVADKRLQLHNMVAALELDRQQTKREGRPRSPRHYLAANLLAGVDVNGERSTAGAQTARGRLSSPGSLKSS
ncbi:hypothetical protein VTN00DRAFT_2452 [Thermoascus crustaceus]|uniref:uncharacterized protein n=1 Tax=Thermoascus crustaceus TaxID=5088 RepID=UPI00374253BE